MPLTVHTSGLHPAACRCVGAPVQRQRAVRSVKCFSEASTDEPTPKRKKNIKSTIADIDSLLGIEEEVKVLLLATPAVRHNCIPDVFYAQALPALSAASTALKERIRLFLCADFILRRCREMGQCVLVHCVRRFHLLHAMPVTHGAHIRTRYRYETQEHVSSSVSSFRAQARCEAVPE